MGETGYFSTCNLYTSGYSKKSQFLWILCLPTYKWAKLRLEKEVIKKKSQGLGYFLLFNKKYKVAKVDQ